jgi:hypothetical protein
MDEKLEGVFWFLFAFDVCDEIQLDAIPSLVGNRSTRRATDLGRPTPDYVRFERPPIVEYLDPFALHDGEQMRGELRLYDYGVISVKLELRFLLAWPDLVERSRRLLDASEPKDYATRMVKTHLDRISSAAVRARPHWLDEEYYVVQVISPNSAAQELIQSHGADIAKIVRGEERDLSDPERDEILRPRISYYPNDLMVVGWEAAFVHDNAEGAAGDLQLLEYANTQLLELRYYDRVLTDVLQEVYKYLDQKPGLLERWRMGREARRLNTILLDVRELTERSDTAIKFLSDMFSARVYRLAADKIGVGDYRRLVDGKLQIASELYQFMVDQFHESRGFVLEVMVVIILIIELYFLFRGESV